MPVNYIHLLSDTVSFRVNLLTYITQLPLVYQSTVAVIDRVQEP